MKRLRPQKYDYASDDDDDNLALAPPSSDGDNDDDMATLSFGALNQARKQLADDHPSQSRTSDDYNHHHDDDDDSDDDAPPEELTLSKKRSKHAPAKLSTKKRVGVVRPIHGLDINPKYNQSSLYKDIRFDAAYGKADQAVARANYAFLDEYRELEIKEVKALLKQHQLLPDYERRKLEYQAKSLQSRLDTLRSKDRDRQVLREYKHKHQQRAKDGESGTSKPFYLKKSDERKILQKAKFELMTARQREKAVERKRKRRLGKEMRALEGDGFK